MEGHTAHNFTCVGHTGHASKIGDLHEIMRRRIDRRRGTIRNPNPSSDAYFSAGRAREHTDDDRVSSRIMTPINVTRNIESDPSGLGRDDMRWRPRHTFRMYSRIHPKGNADRWRICTHLQCNSSHLYRPPFQKTETVCAKLEIPSGFSGSGMIHCRRGTASPILFSRHDGKTDRNSLVLVYFVILG